MPRQREQNQVLGCQIHIIEVSFNWTGNQSLLALKMTREEVSRPPLAVHLDHMLDLCCQGNGLCINHTLGPDCV